VESLSADNNGWQLNQRQYHEVVVLANGHHQPALARRSIFPCIRLAVRLAIFRRRQRSKLRQVLCYDGYLTPQNPHNQQHCIGASYHRGQERPRLAPRISSRIASA
jgi:tRNA 5-methylaminomethyl-2-thiouridine biosynthesis bifunctional protein